MPQGGRPPHHPGRAQARPGTQGHANGWLPHIARRRMQSSWKHAWVPAHFRMLRMRGRDDDSTGREAAPHHSRHPRAGGDPDAPRRMLPELWRRMMAAAWDCGSWIAREVEHLAHRRRNGSRVPWMTELLPLQSNRNSRPLTRSASRRRSWLSRCATCGRSTILSGAAAHRRGRTRSRIHRARSSWRSSSRCESSRPVPVADS